MHIYKKIHSRIALALTFFVLLFLLKHIKQFLIQQRRSNLTKIFIMSNSKAEQSLAKRQPTLDFVD